MRTNFYILAVCCCVLIPSGAASDHPKSFGLAKPLSLAKNELDEYDDIGSIETFDSDYDETYASEYPYGQPLEPYHADRRSGRQARAHVRIIHRTGKPKSYAKKYKTWAPAKDYLKPKHRPKQARPPPQRKPGRRQQQASNQGPNRRRKFPPPKGNQLRRPKPPPPDYDYYADEEYFPEESKRKEYAERPKKHGRPGSGVRVDPNVAEDVPSVSYSNFVHHPKGQYDFDVEEEVRKPERKRKRKRKKNKIPLEDLYSSNSESVEEHQPYENFPPYNPPQQSLQRPVRQPIQQSIPGQQIVQPSTPVYGDGYLGNQQKSPHNINIRGSSREPSQFRNEPQSVAAQTFNEQNYQNYQDPQFSNVYNKNPYNKLNENDRDVITQQNYNQFTSQGSQNQYSTNIYNQPPVKSQPFSYNQQNKQDYSQQDYIKQVYNPQDYKGYSQQESNNKGYSQQEYNKGYSQQESNKGYSPQDYSGSAQVYSQRDYTKPDYNQNRYNPATTSANEYSSRYKSSSFFDNTDTYSDFNQNIELQEKIAKKKSAFVASAAYQEADADSDFINRHQQLYSNGMNGVPVQGLTSAASAPGRVNDYDIGYGEIHYDETHRT